MPNAPRELVRMLRELAAITDEPGRLTRTFLSPAMRRANRVVAGWMRAAGLSVCEDRTGNIIGRCEGPRGSTGTFVLGSHLDTVRDAGSYDGVLGVVLPIVALAELRQRGVKWPFAIEVVGFSEEEGVRFASAYLGSKGYTGQLTAADMQRRDIDNITVRRAIAQWNESRSGAERRDRHGRNLLGYLETHIEQGPVLEKSGLAVGVVSAIAGQTRGTLTFEGRAGHAGTTPMTLRRDALAGTAEFVLAAEALAGRVPSLVATVGSAVVSPGTPNVIPGRVDITLDVRHPKDRTRRAAVNQLIGRARRIATRRGLIVEWRPTQDNQAVQCSSGLSALLAQSVRAVQKRSPVLISGAGHDAVVMSAVAPVVMLLVRCRGGLSHHPDEFARAADMEVALRVVMDFLERIAIGGLRA